MKIKKSSIYKASIAVFLFHTHRRGFKTETH